MSEKWTKLRTNRLQENVPLHLKSTKICQIAWVYLTFLTRKTMLQPYKLIRQ